jgi:predicted nucleic acid-binding protein
MIVADASVLFDVLSDGPGAAGLALRLFGDAEPVCAPHLVDAEIAHVLRKHVLGRRIVAARAQAALQDFVDMRLLRFAHTPLLPRAFELRNTMTAYDALYVALAETLGATFITRDGKLGRTAASIVMVEIF